MLDPRSVEDAGADFALRIMERLALILPSGDLGFTSTASIVKDTAFVVISQSDELGLELTVKGQPLLRLVVEYRCMLSTFSKMLTVSGSTYKVYLHGSRYPIFAADYDRSARPNTPAAHWNVYANRKDVTDSLRRAGSSRRGGRNRRAARDRSSGVVGTLHFPVGGHRYRPCLEDVLELVWTEYGIDVRTKSARKAIDDGRREWRTYQLKAAVSDDPRSAAEELHRLGVPIDMAAFPVDLGERPDRTTAW